MLCCETGGIVSYSILPIRSLLFLYFACGYSAELWDQPIEIVPSTCALESALTKNTWEFVSFYIVEQGRMCGAPSHRVSRYQSRVGDKDIATDI